MSMTRDTINMIIGILGSNTEIVENYIVYKTYDDSSIGGVWVNNNVRQQIYNSNERCWYMILMDGVTAIGGGWSTDYSPFYSNSSVTEIDLSSSGLTSIGECAFASCSSLTSITIPDSITSIGVHVFNYCSGLTSITIPSGVTFIGRYVFVGCSGLTSIVVDSNNTTYDSRNNCNAIIETSINTLIAGCQNTIIPNDVTSIGDNAFWDCSSLTSITIPDSITSIGDWAFSHCSGLTSITIPDSVTSISEGAFNYCTSLTSITIPDSITSIGQYAFGGCSGLTSIAIPNSVTSIGEWAFADCSSLTSVTCLATTPPTLGSNNFTTSNDILYVPSESVDLYKADANWLSAFGVDNILPIV